MANYEKMRKAELIRALKAKRRRPAGDLERVVHELEVHQEELELQNIELRETHQQLEESRDRYAQLYDFSPVGYLSLDPAGCMLELNLAAAALLGAERARLIGKPLISYVEPADRKQILSHLRECRNGRPQVKTELKLKTTNGVREIELISAAPADEAVLFRTAISDITERKRAAEALRESEQRFRQLAENISEVFYLTDIDGDEFHYVSPAFENVWGVPADTLYREPQAWQESIHPEDREQVRRVLKERRPDQLYEAEFRITRADGALRWIRARGFPIRDASGRPYRVAGIARDVTERKEAAAAQEETHQRLREFGTYLESAREEERTRVARYIHDELGAVLLAIKIDLDACRKEQAAPAPGTAATMEELMRQVDAAIEAVRRISTALRPSILDNVGVVAAVQWQAEEVSRRTGIHCKVVCDSGQEELDLDAERATAVFRIVQEALTNVVKHSSASRAIITLRERAQGVELNIKDNGRGFDTSRPRDARAWGLVGMAERARAFGGEFSVRSAPQRGTAIRVVLPAGASAPPPPLAQWRRSP